MKYNTPSDIESLLDNLIDICPRLKIRAEKLRNRMYAEIEQSISSERYDVAPIVKKYDCLTAKLYTESSK